VKELQLLKYCKGVHPRYAQLMNIKESLEHQIGEESVARILKHGGDKMDEEIAQRELRYESRTHRAVLLKSLTWGDWVYYHTGGLVDRTLRSIFN
jgi:hypothetical protein